MHMPNYWIGVVSQEHVARGVAGGFAQVCHGKAAPLKRMNAGDWLIYYSPRTSYPEGAPCQAFTAIGRVRDGLVYEFAMTADFVPARRDIDFAPCDPAPIQPLIELLAFIKDKRRWGYQFRTGLFAITSADFALIAAAMNVDSAILEAAYEPQLQLELSER